MWRVKHATFSATNSGPEGISIPAIGRHEEIIRAYIKNQEIADQQPSSVFHAGFLRGIPPGVNG
jgi:hypothetical protein